MSAAKFTPGPQSVEPVPGAVWYEGSVSLIRRGSEDDYCARHPGATRVYFAQPTQPTDAEWQEEAMRLALAWAEAAMLLGKGVKVGFTLADARIAFRAHIATRPLPAPPTKKEQP